MDCQPLFLRISRYLRKEDVSRMQFLLVDLADIRSDIGAHELFVELEVRGYLTVDDMSFLSGVLRAISRCDLARQLDRDYSERNADEAGKLAIKYPLSHYREFLVALSVKCESKDVHRMKFLVEDIIPPGILEDISSALALFSELEKYGVLGPQDLSVLGSVLENIPRMDLAAKLQEFQVIQQRNDSNDKSSSSFGLRHLPADYVNRSSDVEEVKRLLHSGQSSVSVVGTRGKDVVGIKGMGGIGKTVLAQAVCWQLRITRQVIWINVGQTPQLLSLLNMLATAISGKQMSFSDKVKAQDWIQENTADKDSLVVLDDVWDVEHASAFDVLSGACQLLITTRNSDVVRGLRGSELHKLGALSKEQARELLAKSAQKDLNLLSKEIKLLAEQILDECGGLPLALALIGSSLLDSTDDSEQDWRDRLEGLKDADLDEIRCCFPKESYPYEHLMAAIDVSFKALPEQYRTWYLDLAVFPEDTEIPSHVLEMMWNDVSCDRSDKRQRKLQRRVQEALSFLEKRSVLQNGTTGHSYLVHDILLDYLQGKLVQERGVGALKDSHNALLVKYKSKCHGEGWSGGPNGDTYFFQHLSHHLFAAGRISELLHELSNFDWLQKKLEETDLVFLLSDFKYVKDDDEELALIRLALVLSSNVISQNKEQLGPQVLGRLRGISESDRVFNLMEQMREHRGGKASLVPLNSCLTPPGGPLIRTTDSRGRTVVAIVVTPDRKKIITGSSDASIKVWDFKSGKELVKLSNHAKVVYTLALSENGALLVSGSFDATIKVWDMDTMLEKNTLRGHDDLVNGVVISPDNQCIVSCSNDSTVRVWDLGRGTLLHTLTGHDGHVRGIAMTSDGTHVISGSQDGTVKLWDVKNFTERRTYRGHSDTVYAVCFSPDERYAISGSGDQVVKIWNISSGEEVRSLIGHTSEIYSVAMTPDGEKVLSTSDDKTVRVWDFSSGEELYALNGHSESVRVVMVTPEGDIAISGSEDYTYKLWDLNCTRTTAPFAGHQRSINGAAMSSDGSMCVTVSDDHLLKVWDCRRVEEVATLAGHDGAIQSVALHPEGSLAASGGSDLQVKFWDLTSMQELSSFTGHEHPVQVLKFSQDGDVLVSASKDNTVALWDWKNGANIGWIKAPIYDINDFVLVEDSIFACSAYNKGCMINTVDRAYEAVTFSGPDSRPYPAVVLSDGSGFLSGSAQGSYVRYWETDSGREVRYPCGHPPYSVITALAVSTDGRNVISCSDQGSISKLQLQSGKHEQLCCYPPSQEGVTIGVIALLPPDDSTFVTADSLGVMKLWSISSGPLTTINSCDARITALRVLAGNRIAASDERGKLHLIDNLKDDAGVVVIEAHAVAINVLEAKEENDLIATGSDDGSIKIWKVSSPKDTPRLSLLTAISNAHRHGVTALAFTDDSSSVISGSRGNDIIQWDLKTGDQVMKFHSSSFGVNCVRTVGDRVFVCLYDCTAAVWSLSDGRQLKTITGRGGRFHVSKVLPERNQVFSDGSQYTVKCWRPWHGNQMLTGSREAHVINGSRDKTGTNLLTLRGHTDEVTALCLLPDGDHVITGSRDKTMRLWGMSDGGLVSAFYFEQGLRTLACSANGLIAVGLSNGQLCFMSVHC